MEEDFFDILDTLALRLYEETTSGDGVLSGLDLDHDDFKEAIYASHEKYGNPDIETIPGIRANYSPEGKISGSRLWKVKDPEQGSGPSGQMTPRDLGYDYLGYDPKRRMHVVDTEALGIDDIPARIQIDSGERMWPGYKAEMAHAMQFHDLDAEYRDSLLNEVTMQGVKFGDSWRPNLEITTPVGKPLLHALSNLPGGLGDFFERSLEHDDWERTWQSKYDIAEQLPDSLYYEEPYWLHSMERTGDDYWRHGQPTVEYEATHILEDVFEQEIYDYLLKLAEEKAE